MLVGDGGLFSLAVVFFDPSIVLPVFVALFTSSPLLIGAPAAIRLAGLYLPQLPVAIGIRHLQHIKPFFFWQAAVGRAALGGCVVAALVANAVPAEVVLTVLLVAWAVFSFTEGAATLAWLDLVGEVVHARLRGRYFGVVGALGGALAIAAGFVVSEAMAADIAASTFARLFGWGCLAFLVSVVCIALVRERRDNATPSLDEPPLSHIRSLVRGGHLLRVGTAQVLAGSLQLALPFYVLFARDNVGLSGEWLGTFIVAQTVGGSVSALAWARIAEHHGARQVVMLSTILLIAIPALAMAAERAFGGFLLLLVFFLAGAARGGSMAGFWQYILDLVASPDRRLFMGLANTANAPTLLMPVIGGVLLAWGGFMWLFAASIALGVLAVIASGLLPRTNTDL